MPDVSHFEKSNRLEESLHESLSKERLPIVDISPYLDSESTQEEREVCSKSLDSACRRYGFFYVVGHGLPQEYLDSLLRLGHKFFELPDESKDAIRIFKSQDKVRGYQRIGENVTYGKRDLQEALDIYPEPEFPSEEPLNGSQLWPSEQDLPGFKSTMLEYSEKMKVVGKAFMRAMADALGHEEVFDELQADPYWVLRVIGYPPMKDKKSAEDGISCGAHTDYGCLTFLLADDTPGSLQVEAKDGSWIPVDPIPGGFIVNIGDIIDSLTVHTYKSTFHRVIHKGSRYRVSIPFFFEPSQHMTIRPLKGFVTPENEDKVKEFKYFDHLKRMIYNHFVTNDKPLPDKPNVNELTQRG
ncbi:Clavaminate synthase-like protein [Violaceomyces palustris]|uniref:Clavaminate synthase-like protein n=1 Tax=Violaceomyces palustris TaxID=1673888 RepID=A0ACD0NSJ5_9BASI|nr:Clavaminate synthase-like protein [Violaceomyces palustris]